MPRKAKLLSQYLKQPMNAVLLIPLVRFKMVAKPTQSTDLFGGLVGSRLLPPDSFSALLGPEYLQSVLGTMGTLEANFLNSCYTVFVPIKDAPVSSDQAIDLLNDYNALAKNFVSNLWHVRDNNVNSEAGYMIVNTAQGLLVHKNDMLLHYYNAHGKDDETTEFNHKEVKDAAAAAILSASANLNDAKKKHRDATSRIKGDNRANRFAIWVNDARRQSDVLTKVAIYITALEALLSTSNAELSHQLSERVAILKPEQLDDSPVAIYRKMKQAYGFRSKALHGAAIKTSEQQSLIETSDFLDSLCRGFQLELLRSKEFHSHFESNGTIEELFIRKLLIR